MPVKSVTLQVPKQTRFRLDYKGNLLDFHNMTDAEVKAYFQDEVEQERQNSPGLRHRNKETIRCRYSYISSREKVLESLERIKRRQPSKFKAMVYHSESKEASKDESSNRIHHRNRVHELNIYQPSDLMKWKVPCETKNKFRYEGPEHKEVNNNFPEFNDVPLQDDFRKATIKDDLIEVNPEKILILYLHGRLRTINDCSRLTFDSNLHCTSITFLKTNSICTGGAFFSQGPKSCEIFLRRMVDELAGVPILGIDYSLTVPFPVPIQEVLDIYLWIFSGRDEVKETLGFHPKKVVFFGDSAGAYSCLSATVLINELNKKIGMNNQDEYAIPLPKSLLFAYPVMHIKTSSPSRALCMMEPLVAIHPLMLVAGFFATGLASNGDYKKMKKSECC